MNINKIGEILNVKENVLPKEKNEALEVINGTSSSTEVIRYTNNPEVLKEIDRYKNERENSLGALIDARTGIIEILNKGNILESIKVGADWKDIDAFSKLINTLTGLTQKIDDLSNPQKVETYLEPQEEKASEDNIVNIQQNNFLTNPTDLINLLKGKNV